MVRKMMVDERSEALMAAVVLPETRAAEIGSRAAGKDRRPAPPLAGSGSARQHLWEPQREQGKGEE